MAIQKRQSNLFAAEDWKVVYESFRKINLTAYDYDTIRESMINYIRITYPDSFNDWIENDEFIFLLDTISFLGQNLAFRMDMNTRENMWDTQDRRESVLRLATMISYSPRRNYPARGIAKVTEIQCNQDISDSSGNSLKGVTIRWADPLNPDWYEQFILVMNASFVSTNQFGSPIKRYRSGSIETQIYRFNSLPYIPMVGKFSATVNGEAVNMEVVNPDIDDNGIFFERAPNPEQQRHIIYRNDGNGFNSPNNGFYVMIKQGSLSKMDYRFNEPLENRVVNIDTKNINELDVWVQETNESGMVLSQWSKVPSLQSVSYNSVDRKLKDIYSVTTREDDMITLKFPDSRSGTVPRGSYRVWYRVSNGKSYTIKTSDIQDKTYEVPYRSRGQSASEQQLLKMKFSLQNQIQNAQTAETTDQIKERAPQRFYTQNRLITGEDYNIGPLMQGNLVLKSKAINRIYSGQSRFIDFTDPTGKYQSTNIFVNDGAIYRDSTFSSKFATETLPTMKSNSTILIERVEPLIGDISVIQKYQESPSSHNQITLRTVWNVIDDVKYARYTYGKLLAGQNAIMYGVGTLLKFVDPSDSTNDIWSSVVGVVTNPSDDTDIKLQLSMPIPNGWVAVDSIYEYRSKFTSAELQQISNIMDRRVDFVVYYNCVTAVWKATDVFDSSVDYIVDNNIEYPILVKVTFNSSNWGFQSIGINYIFCGGAYNKFFFIPQKKITDISTGTTKMDELDVLSINIDPETGRGYSNDIRFTAIDTYTQENGFKDPTRLVVTVGEVDQNGIPLNPSRFDELVPVWDNQADKLKFESFLVLRANDDLGTTYIDLPNADFTFLDTSYPYTIGDVISEQDAYKRMAFERNVKMRSTKLDDLLNKSSMFTIMFIYQDRTYVVEQTVGNNNDRLVNIVVNLTLPTDDTSITLEEAFYRALMNEINNESVAENMKLSYYGYVDVSSEYILKGHARPSLKYHWKHYAPDDNRIDPSKTVIIDMFVLTTSYRDQIQVWAKNKFVSSMPKPPTNNELDYMFSDIVKISATSDTLIWHSATFIPLFGLSASDDLQATFNVIKTPNSTYSDDEIKQRVIALIDEFFDVENWDFGESFFYTELCTYIHTQLATDIATVVIVPRNAKNKFGNLFEIPCGSEELFISTATVDDVKIVNSLTPSNMNIGL